MARHERKCIQCCQCTVAYCSEAYATMSCQKRKRFQCCQCTDTYYSNDVSLPRWHVMNASASNAVSAQSRTVARLTPRCHVKNASASNAVSAQTRTIAMMSVFHDGTS